jgi:D-alanyl-D-alanine carboxypeptidase/Bacterial Ig domain
VLSGGRLARISPDTSTKPLDLLLLASAGTDIEQDWPQQRPAWRPVETRVRPTTWLTSLALAGALATTLAVPALAVDTPADGTAGGTAGGTADSTAEATPTAPPNGAPTPVSDEATVESGQTVTVDVLGNDSDPDHDPLTVTAVTNGAHGVAAVPVSGDNVTYSASSGYVGLDSITYTVSDPGGATATATVSITVTGPSANTVKVAGTVVALRASSITGTVAPASPALVSVVLQRKSATGWTSYRTTAATSSGTYAFSYVPSAAGTIVWRTVATWHDGTQVTSATHSMMVLARMDAAVSGPLTARDVPYSYRPGCPVSPSGLRRITMTFYDYQGRLQRGNLIVSAGSVEPLLNVFQSGFNTRFPLKKVHPTDHYYANGKRSPSGSDVAAMRHGNTSAFNCRPVTGNPYRQSQHSYGNAVDINTFENPYVTGSRVYPSKARSFLIRSDHRMGMILKKGSLAKAMRRNGWAWGARWAHPDYQHFSANGG